MLVEYILVAIIAILSISNFIIYKKKISAIKMVIGLFACLLYFVFKTNDFLNGHILYYELFDVVIIVLFSLFYFPKKVTKNITEYDYFELEKSYYNLKNDREKLRQRYLSTISLIDEGVIFYENGLKDVILSDKALEIFGGKQALSIQEHAERIISIDRQDYLKQIEKTSLKQMSFEIKYRINKNGTPIWILERGYLINVDNKPSIISTITPLDVKCFISTSYFDVDSLNQEEKMYPYLKTYLDNKRSFSFVYFELSNISKINSKYGREFGSLMMNDYIKFIRNNYQIDVKKMFRVTGIRYVLIIDDNKVYEEFHNDLINNQSEIYNTRIQIAGIKETIIPNFGIINLKGNNKIESIELFKLAEKLLEESIDSNRRNYTIFGE